MTKNCAIAIGINDYQQHPERRLKYAVNDAQKMGNFLSNQAGFGAENVIQCLGDEVHRGEKTYPTCSNLLRLLEKGLHPDFLGKVDRFWFYFSGHGISQNGRDYLITSDCLDDQIERFALPIDEVIAKLQAHQDADIVLILDTCRQVLGKKSFDSSIGEQTIASAKERGITTIFSCDYGQCSYELEALQQGAFTAALIEGLSKHTLPQQLEAYLRQRVPVLNSEPGHHRVEQTPRIRVEPVARVFESLLPEAVTSDDIDFLYNQAINDELESRFEEARIVWRHIIHVSESAPLRQKGIEAIERIDGKRTGSVVNLPSPPVPRTEKPAPPPSPQAHQFPGRITEHIIRQQSRQQFLKWLFWGGTGAVLVTGVGLLNQQQSLVPTSVDYSQLEGFLKAQQWKESDRETLNVILKVAGREQASLLDGESLQKFPCDVLMTLDQLWIEHSNGKFGFSVQKKVWEEVDSPTEYNAQWEEFGDRVGWRLKERWILYSSVNFITSAPSGHLPAVSLLLGGGVSFVSSRALRLMKCSK